MSPAQVSRRAASTVTTAAAGQGIAAVVRRRPYHIISSKGFFVSTRSSRLLSTLQRGPSSSSQGILPIAQQHHYYRLQHSPRHTFQSQFHQVRRESSGSNNSPEKRSSESQELRSVGFEDVNASLPTDPESPASPTHKPVIIDVREPVELSSTGIIPGAVSIPLASQPDAYFLSPEEFETRFGYPKPGVDNVKEISSKEEQEAAQRKKEEERSDIIFYCKAGVRARAAAQLAVQAGYDPARIGVYDGSWLDWVDRGGKVERWEGDE